MSIVNLTFELWNGLFTSLLRYMSIVTLNFNLWPQNSIGSILWPWLAKFDEHNVLVSIVSTSLFPYMSIVTLTFDLQNQLGSSSRHD